MQRRNFIAATVAAVSAPILGDSLFTHGAHNLAPVGAPFYQKVPVLWGDGVQDDAPALQALFDGRMVFRPNGTKILPDASGSVFLTAATYSVGSTISLRDPGFKLMLSGCRFVQRPEAKGAMFMVPPGVSVSNVKGGMALSASKPT